MDYVCTIIMDYACPIQLPDRSKLVKNLKNNNDINVEFFGRNRIRNLQMEKILFWILSNMLGLVFIVSGLFKDDPHGGNFSTPSRAGLNMLNVLFNSLITEAVAWMCSKENFWKTLQNWQMHRLWAWNFIKMRLKDTRRKIHPQHFAKNEVFH